MRSRSVVAIVGGWIVAIVGCSTSSSNTEPNGCAVDPSGDRWRCVDETHGQTLVIAPCDDPECGCGGGTCTGYCDKPVSDVVCAPGMHCVPDLRADGGTEYDAPCQADGH